MRAECPHCKSPHAIYVSDHQDVALKCLCGYFKVVATKLESMTIEHRDDGARVILPKRETKLWYCLMALYSLSKASTEDICETMNTVVETTQTMSEVSSQLTVLKYKGLVDVIENRKGKAGGSTWQLTTRALELVHPQ